MNNRIEVYVVLSEDNEVVGVATNLVFAKKIILNGFEDESVLNIWVDDTIYGHTVTVKESGYKYIYHVERHRLRGVI